MKKDADSMCLIPSLVSRPILTAAFVLLCAGTGAIGQSTPNKNQSPGDTSSAEKSNVYQRWLDEEVRWIATPEERTDFLGLPNIVAERDHFIEAFWLRRDPTPGTVQNEFKEEHYRRLAYANVHFAGTTSGWKTDRGRVYIVYGPPSEVRSEPARSGDNPTEQAEIWHYRVIVGVGRDIDVKFSDACNCGDYGLDSLQRKLLFHEN